MFFVRDIHSTDLPTVYKFTLKLLCHHIGLGETSYLRQEQLTNLFHEGLLQGLLLVRSGDGDVTPDKRESNGQQAVGYMIFHSDVSLHRGCRGVLLDQFYIEPEFRLHGLGTMMMRALCERVVRSNGHYIKLFYQDGIGVDKFYSKLGFVNHTKNEPRLHIFEVYGPAKLDEFLHTPTESEPSKVSYPGDNREIPHVLVLPFSQIPSEGKFEIPSWLPTSHLLNVSQENVYPLCAKLVIVTENLPQSVQPPLYSTTSDITLLPRGPRFCLFIEQCSICSWLGPMVNFSDFVGDTSVLTPELLFGRVRSWSQASPLIRGAIWEVPGCITPSCGKKDDLPPFQRTLHHINVLDDTWREGWNVAILDSAGMHKLIASVDKDAPPK